MFARLNINIFLKSSTIEWLFVTNRAVSMNHVFYGKYFVSDHLNSGKELQLLIWK